MFSESAALYDLIYRSFKNYTDEAAQVARLLREANPAVRTVLDVGCGTAEHAAILTRDHGFLVDGLDLDPELLAVARAKLPEARFYERDMAAFEVDHRYDAVICL